MRYAWRSSSGGAAVVIALATLGCAEKFELPPAPQGEIPQEGVYNFDRSWSGVGRVIDLVLAGSGLYVLSEINGTPSIKGYVAEGADLTPLPSQLTGNYRGLVRPVVMAAASYAAVSYLYVADQRGPDLLSRTRDCADDPGDCSLRLQAFEGGASRQLAARSFDPIEDGLRLSGRFRLDEPVPSGGAVDLVAGTSPGRIGVWLRVTSRDEESFIRPVRSDGATTVDSLRLVEGEWHELEVTYKPTPQGFRYAVTVDTELLTTTSDVPPFHPMNRAFEVLALRFSGPDIAMGLDRVRLEDTGVQRDLIINEALVDGQNGEFVEIKGMPGTPLGIYRIVGRNGDGSQYDAVDLAGAVPPSGYFVLARDSSVVNATQVVTGTWADGTEQVHGLELRHRISATIVLDALAYGEIDTAEVALEGSPAANVPPGSSHSRCPSGSDRDHNLTDFTADATPTPGARNDACEPVHLRLDFETDDEVTGGWALGPYFRNDPPPVVHRFLTREDSGPIQTMTDPDWFAAEGIALDRDLTLYVATQERDPSDPTGVDRRGLIRRIDRLGVHLDPLSETGSGLGYVLGPKDLYFDGTGLLVIDEVLNRAEKLDPTTPNTGLFQIPPLDAGEAWFAGPQDIVADETGFIYVADTRNNRVLRFTPEGAFADTVYSLTYPPTLGAGVIVAPAAIEADSNEVWIGDPEGERIVVLKRTGSISGGGS